MWLSQPWLSQLCLSISPEDQTELHQSVALMGVGAVGGKDLPLDIQGGPIFLCNRERPEGEKNIVIHLMMFTWQFLPNL